MRSPDYQFVSTNTDKLVAELVAMYEQITGVSVQPASPEKLFILWVVAAIIQERVQSNRIGNQNIPSRAEGENLDALGELFFASERPAAQPAVCTVRFHISEAQEAAVLIPSGTRVTDAGNSLTWATVSDAYIPIGETYIDIPVRCRTDGVVGNGYTPGQINTLVDLYDYCAGCENITASEEGADAATDEEYYELLRSSMDAYSCAGARGSYIYFAKEVSTEISDVAVNSPGAGEVTIYVLMSDGTIAGAELKSAVLEACSREDRRPMTDHVTVADPQLVDYDITFTYYIKKDTAISSAEVQAGVEAAVQEFIDWQNAKLGRDINPDKLREFISTVGKTYNADTGEWMGEGAIKRITLTSPTFAVLRDGKTDGDVPQVARIGTVTVTNGGFEDE